MATSVERVGVEAVEAFEGDWVGERVRDHPWRVNDLVNVHRYLINIQTVTPITSCESPHNIAYKVISPYIPTAFE